MPSEQSINLTSRECDLLYAALEECQPGPKGFYEEEVTAVIDKLMELPPKERG